MAELQDIAQKLEKAIERAGLMTKASLKKARKEIRRRINKGLNELLIRIQHGESISYNPELISLEINRIFDDAVNNAVNPALSSALIRFYPLVEKLSIELSEAANRSKVTTALYKKLPDVQRRAVQRLSRELGAGIAQDMKQVFRRTLIQSAATNAPLKDIRNNLALMVNGTKDGTALGIRVERYAVQIARDALYGYNGELQRVMAKEYGYDTIRYIGGLVSDSRPFCTHVVNGLNGLIAVPNLDTLLKQYKGKDGMRANTNTNNFATLRGGYNCNHIVIYVRSKK